ncbi:MAG: hypothetical protein M3Y27_08795 [Acidobacteriota bacterium]|nr:hypothetical protein [Acidobacteriota bacterium]
MSRLFPAFCLTAALALTQLDGQPAITPPQLGWVRDANSGLRPVTGIAANFIVGDCVTDGVISSAFSGSFGIVKTDASLSVLDRDGQTLFRMDADSGPALFAFSDDGAPAFVYLAQSQTLLKWNPDRLEPALFNLDSLDLPNNPVQAIASPSQDRAAIVVKRPDGLWLVDLDLGTQTLLPGIEGPVLLRNDGSLLYAGPQGLMLRQADRSEQPFEGSIAVATFELMSQDWVHITERDSSRHFAIRLESGREQLYQLPEAQP